MEDLLNEIGEFKIASQKANNYFEKLSERMELQQKEKQQAIDEIHKLKKLLGEKEQVIKNFTNGKENPDALLGLRMNAEKHGLGFTTEKSLKNKSGLHKFVTVVSTQFTCVSTLDDCPRSMF
ncbi:hypothetical protein Taro_002049 [Colocasia esculenta]|uniref:Uncharacterized protein n=1 Tax=Colocasia esculenta TaxID=4460 RepID=A0A843TMG6_COLES|nr:hypothetical protein [Colocasia esculenta]